MPTIEQYKNALIKAHRAGDSRAANLFAGKIKELNSAQANTAPKRPKQYGIAPLDESKYTPEQMQNINRLRALGGESKGLYGDMSPAGAALAKSSFDLVTGGLQTLGKVGEGAASLAGYDVDLTSGLDRGIREDEKRYSQETEGSRAEVLGIDVPRVGGDIATGAMLPFVKGGKIVSYLANTIIGQIFAPVIMDEGEDGTDYSVKKSINTVASAVMGKVLEGGIYGVGAGAGKVRQWLNNEKSAMGEIDDVAEEFVDQLIKEGKVGVEGEDMSKLSKNAREDYVESAKIMLKTLKEKKGLLTPENIAEARQNLSEMQEVGWKPDLSETMGGRLPEATIGQRTPAGAEYIAEDVRGIDQARTEALGGMVRDVKGDAIPPSPEEAGRNIRDAAIDTYESARKEAKRQAEPLYDAAKYSAKPETLEGTRYGKVFKEQSQEIYNQNMQQAEARLQVYQEGLDKQLDKAAATAAKDVDLENATLKTDVGSFKARDLLDIAKDRKGVFSPSQKQPLIDKIIDEGGISPRSTIYTELEMMGLDKATLKKITQKGGRGDIDNIVAGELPELNLQQDGRGYFDRDAAINRIIDEANPDMDTRIPDEGRDQLLKFLQEKGIKDPSKMRLSDAKKLIKNQEIETRKNIIRMQNEEVIAQTRSDISGEYELNAREQTAELEEQLKRYAMFETVPVGENLIKDPNFRTAVNPGAQEKSYGYKFRLKGRPEEIQDLPYKQTPVNSVERLELAKRSINDMIETINNSVDQRSNSLLANLGEIKRDLTKALNENPDFAQAEAIYANMRKRLKNLNIHKFNQMLRKTDDQLNKVVGNLMSDAYTTSQFKNLFNEMGDRVDKVDTLQSYFEEVLGKLDTDGANIDMIYNKLYKNKDMQEKLAYLAGGKNTKLFKSFDRLMKVAKNVKVSKQTVRGSNTQLKLDAGQATAKEISAAGDVLFALSRNNILSGMGIFARALSKWYPASFKADMQKLTRRRQEIFFNLYTNPDNMKSNLKFLERISKAKSRNDAYKIVMNSKYKNILLPLMGRAVTQEGHRKLEQERPDYLSSMGGGVEL